MAEIAMPARVWVCITELTSGRPARIAPWMVKPAGFTPWSASVSWLPS